VASHTIPKATGLVRPGTLVPSGVEPGNISLGCVWETYRGILDIITEGAFGIYRLGQGCCVPCPMLLAYTFLVVHTFLGVKNLFRISQEHVLHINQVFGVVLIYTELSRNAISERSCN
jgi:hypothetical protein